MRERNLMDELNVMLAKAMEDEYKKLLRGRPKRNSEINCEDIINLKIALNCSKSLEEFLNQV